MSKPFRFLSPAAVGAICLFCLTVASINAQTRFTPGARPGEDTAPKVPGFGHVEGTTPIPGFGLDAETRVALLPEDLARADERLQREDANRDGYIDRNEARRGRWSDDPFVYDSNRDNRLNRTELAHRYAQRRIQETASRGGRTPPPASPSSGSRNQPNEEQRREQERRAAEEAARRSGGPQATRESWHLADVLMSRHDPDRNGYLDASERRSMGLDSLAADTNRDFRVSRQELAVWLAQQQSEQNRLVPRELPAWFVELDRDGDGQVSMKEFADEWTDEKLAEFVGYDTNNDGFIEPHEAQRAAERSQGQYANHRLQVIPSKGIIRSEIDVEDAAQISDVDVVLSITHTYTGHLKAFLIGPEGQRVELFAGVGANDDHFDNTILDEEAPSSIRRGRPPFVGRYHTSDRSQDRPGLRQFYQRGMYGKWTLLIEANSDRPGALHSWALVFTKIEGGDPPPMDKEFD